MTRERYKHDVCTVAAIAVAAFCFKYLTVHALSFEILRLNIDSFILHRDIYSDTNVINSSRFVALDIVEGLLALSVFYKLESRPSTALFSLLLSIYCLLSAASDFLFQGFFTEESHFLVIVMTVCMQSSFDAARITSALIGMSLYLLSMAAACRNLQRFSDPQSGIAVTTFLSAFLLAYINTLMVDWPPPLNSVLYHFRQAAMVVPLTAIPYVGIFGGLLPFSHDVFEEGTLKISRSNVWILLGVVGVVVYVVQMSFGSWMNN